MRWGNSERANWRRRREFDSSHRIAPFSYWSQQHSKRKIGNPRCIFYAYHIQQFTFSVLFVSLLICKACQFALSTYWLIYNLSLSAINSSSSNSQAANSSLSLLGPALHPCSPASVRPSVSLFSCSVDPPPNHSPLNGTTIRLFQLRPSVSDWGRPLWPILRSPVSVPSPLHSLCPCRC